MATPSHPYALRHREAARPGLIRILNTMGRDARKLSEMPEGELEQSIHGLRTLIKRLRAYLWFLRPALGKPLYAKNNSTLGKAARRLSSARDLHAVASALTIAAIPHADETEVQSLAHVSQAFAQQTASKQNSNQDAHLLEDVADSVIQTITRIVRVVKANANDWPSPAHRINQAVRRTRKTMKKSLRNKDPQLAHEWRKKTKRLFYLLQLTSSLPHAVKPDRVKQIDELQDTLGNVQDTVVASVHLRKRPPDIDAAHIKQALRLLRKKRKILLKHAHQCGETAL